MDTLSKPEEVTPQPQSGAEVTPPAAQPSPQSMPVQPSQTQPHSQTHQVSSLHGQKKLIIGVVVAIFILIAGLVAVWLYLGTGNAPASVNRSGEVPLTQSQTPSNSTPTDTTQVDADLTSADAALSSSDSAMQGADQGLADQQPDLSK